ncbi:MAG: hypothetical protein VX916_04920 [Planctomycetota bacterium]|nr:hypothetical protein [Planctomycetota bacterium]
MNQHRISIGVLALIVCLALPTGILSMLARQTTGSEIDRASAIMVARIQSVQELRGVEGSLIAYRVEETLFGRGSGSRRLQTIRAPGRPTVGVGDDVLFLLADGQRELVGTYLLKKHDRTLDYEIAEPVTGLWAQRIPEDRRNVPLPVFQLAVLARKGLLRERSTGDETYAGSVSDPYEPNDNLGEATPVALDPPHLVTGMPTEVTGLTLTENDVDFFSFTGSGWGLLHAETHGVTVPEGVTSPQTPDTLMGLFDGMTGELLAHDDDSGSGTLSKLVFPVEIPSTYAVAVESAPDTDLDFSGDEGTTTGSYSLSLELELGSYISNAVYPGLSAGVSSDGSFIEDLLGIKETGAEDVLLSGVAADGWALQFDVAGMGPRGTSHIYGGGGEQLTDPGFTSPLVPVYFKLGPLVGSAGMTRQGEAEIENIVAFSTDPLMGVSVFMEYELHRASRTIEGEITFDPTTQTADLSNALFTRVMDVDLFGRGDDTFWWTYDPASPVRAFPADTTVHVGNLTPPASSSGSMTGDLQAALVIRLGSDDGRGGNEPEYKTAFSLESGLGTELEALRMVQGNLRAAGCTALVVATDQDPVTREWTAFGAGLGE